MDVFETIKARRSVRSYKDESLEKVHVQKILQAAKHAPSARNMQPLKFVVVQNKETIKKLSKVVVEEASRRYPSLALRQLEDPIFYSAPTIIFILGDKNYEWIELDAALAAENMMLHARSQDIASCFVGYARLLNFRRDILDELKITGNLSIIATLIFGYPKEWPEMPEKKEPEVVEWFD